MDGCYVGDAACEMGLKVRQLFTILLCRSAGRTVVQNGFESKVKQVGEKFEF